MNNIRYVGMDVHKSVTVIAVINEQGQLESLTKIKTKAENFRDYFRGLSGTTHVVLEEGSWSAWLYKLLKPLVSSVTVCETRHNKLIGAAPSPLPAEVQPLPKSSADPLHLAPTGG